MLCSFLELSDLTTYFFFAFSVRTETVVSLYITFVELYLQFRHLRFAVGPYLYSPFTVIPQTIINYLNRKQNIIQSYSKHLSELKPSEISRNRRHFPNSLGAPGSRFSWHLSGGPPSPNRREVRDNQPLVMTHRTGSGKAPFFWKVNHE